MIPFIIMIRNKNVEKGHGVWVFIIIIIHNFNPILRLRTVNKTLMCSHTK